VGIHGLPHWIHPESLQAPELKKLLLILLATPCIASGPKYGFEDPKLNDELTNVYYDIRNVLKGSTVTIRNISVSSLTVTGSQSVKGVTDGSSSCTGCIGQYIESVIGATNFPATGVWGDATSITLTAGDWDVTVGYYYDPNGSSHSGNTNIGIGTTSGNSGATLTRGENWVIFTVASGATHYSGAIANYRKSVSASTPVYLKYLDNYGVATPILHARLSARRIR